MDFKNSAVLIIFVGTVFIANTEMQQECIPGNSQDMSSRSVIIFTKKTTHPLAFLVSYEIMNDAYFIAAQHHCSSLSSMKDSMEALDYIDSQISCCDSITSIAKGLLMVTVLGIPGFYIAIIKDVAWESTKMDWVPAYLKLWSLAALIIPILLAFDDAHFNRQYIPRLEKLRTLLLQKIESCADISRT